MPSGPIPSRISDSDIEFIFRFVDTLSIGYINRDQFHRALYALGWNTVDYGDVRMLLEIAGKHPQNGLLNQSEFATIVKQNQFKSDSPEEIDAAFRLFDQNRTGYITAENLRNVWEMVTGRTASMTTKSVTAAAVSNRDGPTTTASGDVLVRDILHAFDTNRDGVLDLKEFRTAVAPHLYPPEGAAAAPRSTSASSSPKARSNRNDKTVCSSDSKMLRRSNSRGLLTTGSGSGSFSTLTSKPKLETLPRSSSRNSLEKQASTPKYQRSSSQPTLDEKIEEMHRATSSNNMSRSSFLGLSSMVGVGSKSDLLQEEPPHESSAVAPRTHNSFRTIVPTTTRSPSASYQPFSGLEGNRSGSFSNIMQLYGEDRLASSNQSPPLRETSPTMNRTPAVEAVPSPTPSKGNTTDLAKGYTIQEEDNITCQTSPKQASYQNATASTRNKTRTMSQRSGSFDMSRTVGISTSPKSNPSTPMNFTKNTVSSLQKTSSNLQTKTDSRKTSSAKMKSPNAPVAVYGTGTGTSFRQSSDNNTLVANHSATSKKAEDVGEWYCPITYVAGGAFEMDRNNGTCASRTSVRTALEDLGFDANILSAADFDRHFDALDQNRDGALTQEEVFALVSSLQ